MEENTRYQEDSEQREEPLYVISVTARMVGVGPHILRYYERVGLLMPSRSRGNIRLYSERDVRRLRQIYRLVNDLGVNLAGVEVILRMGEKMAEMNKELRTVRSELERLQQAHSGAEERREE